MLRNGVLLLLKNNYLIKKRKMSKLYFWYWAMWAWKSLELLKVAFNYKERGLNVLLFNYYNDRRFWEWLIASRSWLSLKATPFDNNTAFKKYIKKWINAILIDESQFLTKEQVDELAEIVVTKNIPVMCYWIKTDFKTNLFEGSKRLLEIAHSINELKTICWCWSKATLNVRVKNNKIVKEWEVIDIWWDDKYISLCLKHFLEWNIWKKVI